MNTERTPFWLVWCPDGKTPPKHRHGTRESAEMEAARQARVNPGKKFYVLEPVCVAERQDVSITQYNSGLPF
jgi:hypothetical protein